MDVDVPSEATRYHWYLKVAAGLHEPGAAVSFWPTCAVPLTVGVGVAVNTPYATVEVRAEYFRTVVYPDR